MQAFLVSVSTVAIAEMGDRTQLLSMLLAVRFRKPWQIIAGILFATVANHALAALVGVEFAKYLTPKVLDLVVGISMLAMAGWTLIPDKLDAEEKFSGRGAFTATLIAFFISEMGD
jgi:putative Ca2+/H+ antiporter (TMEM165/GDT1 family)